MAGMPFKVGRFAHTLRVRLMREHLGVNVDALSEDDLMEAKPLNPESPQTAWDPNTEQEFGRAGVTRAKATHRSHAGGLVQLATEGVDQVLHCYHRYLMVRLLQPFVQPAALRLALQCRPITMTLTESAAEKSDKKSGAKISMVAVLQVLWFLHSKRNSSWNIVPRKCKLMNP